jgi:mannosylglycoprotein endo-beta-mannosidase
MTSLKLQLRHDLLVAECTEEEIIGVIFQNTALGPDGFSPEFYQVFWNVMKDDLMALFTDFHKGELPLHSLNFGMIILIPKSKEAKEIQ